MIAPQVQVGSHTFDVKVSDREDGGVTVKLMNAALKGTTFKQPPFAEANFVSEDEPVLEAWLLGSANLEAQRLDAIRRF